LAHVVLLGDSIFDNQAYVGRAPDVIRQLSNELGEGWRTTLLAVDGHVTANVERGQIARIPADATHLVLSVGGNDALAQSPILGQRTATVAEAVAMLDEARSGFREDYDRTLEALSGFALPTAVCTIYDANYPAPQAPIIAAALTLFNDVITRAAFARRHDLIDLRLICDKPEDYANPIEPSEIGGRKIARAIADFCRSHHAGHQSHVWAAPTSTGAP
jgi:hypothetical protein